jgi:Fungal Zn(2)-Cys(6) binuclear cluster domain
VKVHHIKCCPPADGTTPLLSPQFPFFALPWVAGPTCRPPCNSASSKFTGHCATCCQPQTVPVARPTDPLYLVIRTERKNYPGLPNFTVLLRHPRSCYQNYFLLHVPNSGVSIFSSSSLAAANPEFVASLLLAHSPSCIPPSCLLVLCRLFATLSKFCATSVHFCGLQADSFYPGSTSHAQTNRQRFPIAFPEHYISEISLTLELPSPSPASHLGAVNPNPLSPTQAIDKVSLDLLAAASRGDINGAAGPRRADQPRMRSSIACLRCRRSKVKCLNEGPGTPCRACQTNGRECTYPEPLQEKSHRRDASSDKPGDGGPITPDVRFS